MSKDANSTLAAGFSAALDWWREAGVEGVLTDAPQQWIAPPEPAQSAAPEAAPGMAATPTAFAAPPPAPAPDRSAWPQDLAGFASWWLGEAWLDGGQTNGRVAPRGERGAALMVLVAEPEREDEAVLLSGPQGRLLTAFLDAAGIASEAVYIASALPRHTPHADWAAMAARGLGEVARHHISLAAPQRLIVFGSNILPLIGHDLANNPAPFGKIHLGEAIVPLMLARDLAVLLGRPQWKGELWRNWLVWSATGAMETETA